MNYTTTINDAYVGALSVQFESRTPRATDAAGQPTETTVEHVARALDEFLAAEVKAARIAAATRDVTDAGDDATRKDALLAEYKLREQLAPKPLAR